MERRASERSTGPQKSHVDAKFLFPFLPGRGPDLMTRFAAERSTFSVLLFPNG